VILLSSISLCNSSDDCLEENNTFEEETHIVGMIFASEEEVNMFYKNYARSVGFGTAKISSKNGDDSKKYFTLACSRARKYASRLKNLFKPNPSTKTECKATVF
jgi:hypothetical protein